MKWVRWIFWSLCMLLIGLNWALWVYSKGNVKMQQVYREEVNATLADIEKQVAELKVQSRAKLKPPR